MNYFSVFVYLTHLSTLFALRNEFKPKNSFKLSKYEFIENFFWIYFNCFYLTHCFALIKRYFLFEGIICIRLNLLFLLTQLLLLSHFYSWTLIVNSIIVRWRCILILLMISYGSIHSINCSFLILFNGSDWLGIAVG